MILTLHRAGAVTATALVASFWISTLISELALDTAAVVAVKRAIPWGFLGLVPALALAGITGRRLSGGAPKGLAQRKLRRMPILALNGGVILIPSALFLASKASAGDFDSAFYAVQAVELIAGAVNLGLLVSNLRDGGRIRQRLRPA